MGEFHANLTNILDQYRAALLEAPPAIIVYSDLNDLRKNQLPESIQTSPINLYAIWSRQKEKSNWMLQYIGQRSVKQTLGRIRQHLFYTPPGTRSKLQLVQKARESGEEIGITAIFIEPDYLRLSIEDELIRQTTQKGGALPWNKKSRLKVRGSKL